MDAVRVLIVDDDAGLRELLVEYLTRQELKAEAVADGPSLRQWLADGVADVVIMDLMLPGEDGLSLTRWLKTETCWPIIMLSARGEPLDRIIGLEVGADDYLAKPFEPRELLARIRAVLRRGQPTPDTVDSGMHFGVYRLDTETRQLWRGTEAVALTAAEYTLLEILVTHPNRVLSRDQIMEWLKGYERDAFDRSIDVRVTRLRRKIEADPAHPVFLRTVWGQGYLFATRSEP